MSDYTQYELDAMYARLHGKEPPVSPVHQLYKMRCGEQPSQVYGDEWHLDRIEKTYERDDLKQLDVGFALEQSSDSALALLSDDERLIARHRHEREQHRETLHAAMKDAKASGEKLRDFRLAEELRHLHTKAERAAWAQRNQITREHAVRLYHLGKTMGASSASASATTEQKLDQMHREMFPEQYTT